MGTWCITAPQIAGEITAYFLDGIGKTCSLYEKKVNSYSTLYKGEPHLDLRCKFESCNYKANRRNCLKISLLFGDSQKLFK